MANFMDKPLAGAFKGKHDQVQLDERTLYRIDVRTTKKKDGGKPFRHYVFRVRRKSDGEFTVRNYYIEHQKGQEDDVLKVRNGTDLELHRLGKHHRKLVLHNFEFRPNAKGIGRHNHWGEVHWEMKRVDKK